MEPARGETPTTGATPEASTEPRISRRELLSGGIFTTAMTLLGAGAVAGALPTPAKAAVGPTRVFRIHPGIGVARVGNADPSTYFVGPEIPGGGSTEPGGAALTNYKSSGNVRPQAARFRVFEYS